ncbi:hypothetical protein L1987_60715 [Smallanthus sonchifolius]|uniref:Uncharacterized protein n=1 Tax=Smallanthus sonchifolius TaxID=185202 RepID=A0ACB9D8S6_9ASTR|nr:hypothetical protein L1987_60715 [Smallanthus sonchifolius]
MEGLFQHHHNKDSIPPFFTISKSFDNKLSAKITLKKKKYRKPLADITNLFVNSLNQSPVISPAVCRPQSCSVFRSAHGEERSWVSIIEIQYSFALVLLGCKRAELLVISLIQT